MHWLFRVGGIFDDCGLPAKRIAVLIAEEKYAESVFYVSDGQVVKGYAGNCPFLKHNREKYLKAKKEKEDALREKEKTEGKVVG